MTKKWKARAQKEKDTFGYDDNSLTFGRGPRLMSRLKNNKLNVLGGAAKSLKMKPVPSSQVCHFGPHTHY